MVSLILSNKALKNGITFNSVCHKLDIIGGSNKSRFKRQIRENPELLEKFNIKYNDDKKIFYYENIKEIDFEKSLNTKIIETEIKLKELNGYEILIGNTIKFITKVENILLTIKSIQIKDEKFIVVGKDEKGYDIELPYTKESLIKLIQSIKDKKSGIKEIDILKRDFSNRQFKQNIQSNFGGLEDS